MTQVPACSRRAGKIDLPKLVADAVKTKVRGAAKSLFEKAWGSFKPDRREHILTAQLTCRWSEA